jgi:hypothetical protein
LKLGINKKLFYFLNNNSLYFSSFDYKNNKFNFTKTKKPSALQPKALGTLGLVN